MRLGSRIKEGYKTLNSVEEVCISRVTAIITIKKLKGNVAYCRIALFLQKLIKWQAKKMRLSSRIEE